MSCDGACPCMMRSSAIYDLNIGMKQYHKIATIFKRDPKNMRYVIEGEWAKPEFEYLANNIWIYTEKVDGTNIRVMWNGSKVIFGGKTDNAQLYTPLIQRLQELFDTTPKRKLFRDTFGEEGEVCFYGEGYGAKIQGSGGNYKADGVDFTLFDIKVGNIWLERSNVEDIAIKFGIKPVPIVGEGTLIEGINLIKNGLVSQWGEFKAEGIVARPKVELQDRRGFRVITKIKARDFA